MKHVHLIGIGGTGLSAIARVLLESGYPVSGSDRQLSVLAQSLQDAGAKVFVGHQAENVNGADVVVRSSAVPDENVEVQAALLKRIPVLKRAEFLGQIMANHQTIAVAGTHGKTSTTAMIAWLLTELEQHPSFIVGSMISGLGTNARSGEGTHFVIEADEYDRMFLGLNPAIAIVTNVEHDHPDCYPTPEDFRAAFQDFVGLLEPDGVLLVCGDDAGARQLLPHADQALTYGLKNPSNDYQARNLIIDPAGGYRFEVYFQAKKLANCVLQVPGEHNVENGLAALAVAHQLSLSVVNAATALGTFQGTGRRFEIIGEANDVTVISDYAHHPTEIRATLSAARARYAGQNIWAVWQPHTYSRSKLLLDEFAASFADADHVLVTDIYAAREPVAPDFSGANLVAKMDHSSAQFSANLSTTTEILLDRLSPGEVLIVLSAGDADQICHQVLEGLQ